MDIKDFLSKMNAVPHVSGYESPVAEVIREAFSAFAPCEIDRFGNLIARKEGKGGPKVMFAAHMDEIGMMVSTVEDGGFVKFSPIGGIDKRNILAQEVTIHGREKVFGVIGIKPPHLTSPDDRKKAVQMHDISIDTGYSKEALEKLVKPGDIITFAGENIELKGKKLSGRALDNIVSVAAMYEALRNLQHYNHSADVYFVATAQEEVGCKGAKTAVYTIEPDIGIAIDVTFGRTPGLNESDSSELGKGPAISTGPGHTRKLFESLKKVAGKNKIPHQIDVAMSGGGTDAFTIQINKGGVYTGLISIPLKYMHSTVETVNIGDIEMAGKLISDYIISLTGKDDWEKELQY